MIEVVTDIALCLEALVPNAKYSGSFQQQSQLEYDDIVWNDERIKPLWQEIKNQDLQIVKNNRDEYIKASFENACLEGTGCSLGFKVNCDQISIANWTSTLVLIGTMHLPDNYILQIRDYDNITRYLTVGQYKQMCIEVGSYYQELYGKKWYYQNEISKAQNKDAVNGIMWV